MAVTSRQRARKASTPAAVDDCGHSGTAGRHAAADATSSQETQLDVVNGQVFGQLVRIYRNGWPAWEWRPYRFVDG